MPSLRKSLAMIGEPTHLPFGLRRTFGGRAPQSLRIALEGMTDPEVGKWVWIGQALSIENTEDSEEVQGVASNGTNWFVSSNGSKRVVVFDDAANMTNIFEQGADIRQAMWADWGQPGEWGHVGALCHHKGSLLVPIQWPFGVWRIDLASGNQSWHKASALPENDMFPWCAVHPVTGVLYTSNYDRPTALRAYDRNTLVYRPQDDIPLGPSAVEIDHVQGGAFTAHARLLLVRSDFNAAFCFSSLNGHFFGAIVTGDFGSAGSELEAVAVREWQINGVHTPIHLLENDNDWPSKDDLYLHSYSVPSPSLL